MNENYIKKNCLNCEHLDYHESYFESYESSGYYCCKREYRSSKEEKKHLDKMQSTKYLSQGKTCFEGKK